MTEAERRNAAKEFAEFWKGKGYEKGQSQPFWLMLLQKVYGVENPADYIRFEDQVVIDSASFIDGYIDTTKILIEQKSINKDLNRPIRQSDGSLLTPFQQAKRYSAELPFSKRPRWIITCNFKEFYIYDMERPTSEPTKILLENLARDYYIMDILIKTERRDIQREFELSMKAGEIVGELYDAILKQYHDPEAEETLKNINKLCVRLVFCLYAEDAGLFGGNRRAFNDYIGSFDSGRARGALKELFAVLNTPVEKRDEYLEASLSSFPYVNGGLFDGEIQIPQFNDTIMLLLANAGRSFDWSEISPTIFGAVFESTLNPETRRSGGMHYTSLENIHKVIDPLFLDDLRQEFEQIKQIPVERTRNNKLNEFRTKLSELTFLDPACGSGNFLTETYLCLRRLENEALSMLYSSGNTLQIRIDEIADIKVSINQFYGIEINDFAVSVAKTALWIAESQMMNETSTIIHNSIDFLPLKTNANIVEGNALTLDWESVVPKDKLNYIMGNPPFVGYSLQTQKQKAEVMSVYVDEHGNPYSFAGQLDYVAAWYFKAAQLIYGTNIDVAFVSTNSITQGEQVAYVWKPLFYRFNINLNFAHRTFQWNSEASAQAHVFCVIVGFSCNAGRLQKHIYANGLKQNATNINAYLLDAPNIFIESRIKPICAVPKMVYGSKPTDGGYFFLTEEEKIEALKKEPNIEKYIKRFLGADEFINSKNRYCLWLQGADPNEINTSKFIMDRITKIKTFREQSKKQATRESALTPTLFQEIRQSSKPYILVPAHTSSARKYIPIGFESPDTICGNANLMIPDADLYNFGVIMSNVHMAWMRVVCGRLGNGYRYSANIVYNNFPWCNPTPEQRNKIEKTAQVILDVREKYSNCSLAVLYNETTMPVELRKAHQENDKAVMQAYGFPTKMTESECVMELMTMYKQLIE